MKIFDYEKRPIFSKSVTFGTYDRQIFFYNGQLDDSICESTFTLRAYLLKRFDSAYSKISHFGPIVHNILQFRSIIANCTA